MNKNIDEYIDFMIEVIKKERQQTNYYRFEEHFQEHTQNQRRFEYDYEEDLYEPYYLFDDEY